MDSTSRPLMSRDDLLFWLTVVSTGCWLICFWWMHRISSRQDKVLVALQQQGGRIEELSKSEHDLIREVHPQVGEIKSVMTKVADQISEEHDEHVRR